MADTAEDSPAQIIPFGKHKGKQVAEIIATDPQYLEWLKTQAWFAEKFRPIYNIIVNAAPVNEATPEHNALQVKFLNDEYCLKVANKAKNFRQLVKKDLEAQINYLANRIHAGAYSTSTIEEWKAKKLLIKTDLDTLKMDLIEQSIHDRSMEVKSDVFFEIRSQYKNAYNERWHFYIELKPSIGDDYPVILRKIKRSSECSNKLSILMYENYCGVGATEEQMRQIFKEAGINTLRFDEIQ